MGFSLERFETKKSSIGFADHQVRVKSSEKNNLSTSTLKIPFNRPFIVGKELQYIEQAVRNGHISGDGAFTNKCQEFMEQKFNAKKVFLTHSCTAALEMAAILCNIEPGDEVILPSFTFVSTANAFYMRGAVLKFVDIRPDTLNLDENLLEKTITDKTKVIVPVHYAGVGCDMSTIMEIAIRYDLRVVEDAAQGVGAKYKGRYLGTFGNLGCYSFHETKNVICGEGGALVINDLSLLERAEIIRDKGTDRKKYFRGEVDKYTWVDIGSSFLPSDILAAFLYAQLEKMDVINNKRKEIFEYYYQALKPLENRGKIRLPFVSHSCKSNYHLFHILLENENTRDRLMEKLRNKKILSIFHYVPLHLSTIGKRMTKKKDRFPITEMMSSRLLRIPMFYNITKSEQNFVIDCIVDFFS